MIYTVCLPNLYYNKKDNQICFHSNPSYKLPKTYYPLPKQIFSGSEVIFGYPIKFDVIKQTSTNGLNVKISISINPENDISIISKIIEAHISNVSFKPNEIRLMNDDSFYEDNDDIEHEYTNEKEDVQDVESEYSDWDTFN